MGANLFYVCDRFVLSDGKESVCNVGYLGLIPGLGRSPGEGSNYPLQYSCLENSMEGGAWQAAVLGVAKSWIGLSNFDFPFVLLYSCLQCSKGFRFLRQMACYLKGLGCQMGLLQCSRLTCSFQRTLLACTIQCLSLCPCALPNMSSTVACPSVPDLWGL